MGYGVNRLEIIKAKLVSSDPNKLKLLFEFIEEQFNDPELEYSGPLDSQKIKKIKANIAEISIQDLEAILDFVVEQIPLSRTSDKAALILNHLSKIEFYLRELKYSKIEKFIFTLTSI